MIILPTFQTNISNKKIANDTQRHKPIGSIRILQEK